MQAKKSIPMDETIRSEISRLVIEKENMDKPLQV